MFIALAATLCGAQACADIALAAVALLGDVEASEAARHSEAGHNRREERRAWARTAPRGWAGQHGRDLAAVARTDSVRKAGPKPAQRLARHVVL